MKRKNSTLERKKKKMKIKKESFFDLLPRQLIDLILGFLDTCSRITLRSTYNIEPWPSTVLSESPWPLIFRNYGWLQKMIEEYQAEPLLIGSLLDKETLESSGTCLALHIGAKRKISGEDIDLFFESLHEEYYSLEMGLLVLSDKTIFNVGDLYNSEKETLLYRSSGDIDAMRNPQYSFYKTQQIQKVQREAKLTSEPLLIRVEFSHNDPIRRLYLKENGTTVHNSKLRYNLF